VKHRITIRGTAVAAGVLAATGAMTAGITGGTVLSSAAAPAVARTGHVGEGAAVSRRGPEAGAKQALIRRRQGQHAARAARGDRDRATRSGSRTTSVGDDARAIAARVAAERYGWGSAQVACLDSLWTRESGWRVHASNSRTGAYGIPQAVPGSKMSAYGADWRTNPVTQIQWGLGYIREVYRTPCDARSAFQAKGWY